MNKELLELYSDYLLSSFDATTATGLSATLEGEVSHDRITRFLSGDVYDSKTLWRLVKPMAREMESDDGVLISDDTIVEKLHTDENEIVSWRFDHSKGRSVKGINLLNCVYHADGVSLPVSYEIIHKPVVFTDKDRGRRKRRSEVSKNELMRRMLRVCQHNSLRYRYALADSWFSSKENMEFIRGELGRHFIMALRSDRTVATFHKTFKSNAALAKSPTKTVRTQSNHCFMSIYSVCRLEWLSVKHGLNHFALRTRIYLKAVQHAFGELQLLKTA